MILRSPLTISALTLSLACALPAQDTQAASMRKDAPTKDIVDIAAGAGQFSTLITAAKAAGLVDALKGDGPITVFAPTDEAFAKLPDGTVANLLKPDNKDKLAAILKYHVVPGNVMAKSLSGKDWADTLQGQSLRVDVSTDAVRIDDARVVKADIPARNGTIHVIDTVLMPRDDIVDTAIASGKFGTLVKAVDAAGLVETLKGDGPFTVFAPLDSAFAKLPQDKLGALLKDKPKLKGVLTYHVIPGRVLSTDLPVAKGDKLSAEPDTVAGKKLRVVRSEDGTVTVNGVRVVKADVIAGNGVIHVLEGVLMP